MKYAVYGTLKQSRGNNVFMEGSEFLGEDYVEGYTLVGRGIPFAITSPEQRVKVEVFEVTDPNQEKSIDGLEGYPGWYDKVKVKTKYGEAFMYTMEEEANNPHLIGEEY